MSDEAPRMIYLQVDGGGYDHDSADRGAVTWCEDKINENDIEYVRADEIVVGTKVGAYTITAMVERLPNGNKRVTAINGYEMYLAALDAEADR